MSAEEAVLAEAALIVAHEAHRLAQVRRDLALLERMVIRSAQRAVREQDPVALARSLRNLRRVDEWRARSA